MEKTCVYNPRNQYEESPFEGKRAEKIENPYWQAYLDVMDAQFVSGYDAGMDTVDGMLMNIDKQGALLSQIGIDVRNINMDIVKEVKLFSEYSDEEKGQMNNATKTIKIFQEMWYCHMENYRDMMIRGFIDRMPDEEYQKIKKSVKDGSYLNIVMRREEKECY